MVTIEFETKQQSERCFEQLSTSLRTFDKLNDEVFLSKNDDETGVTITFKCHNNERLTLALSSISAVMTNFTLKHYLASWLESVVKHQFYFQGPEEIEDIISLTREIMNGVHSDLHVDFGMNELQQELYLLLRSMIGESRRFSFESFLQFRLRKLKKELTEAVEVAIDEYKMEQDYQLMVESCRQYLVQKQPLYSSVHVVLGDTPVSIYDTDGQKFTLPHILRLLDDEVSFDDSLPIGERIISPLVSMAPERVFLYSEGKKEEGNVVRTLLAIFQERLCFCEQSYSESE
ncbi:putative sporulation protein YtxC [Alteribacter aurantiacus]|uniref:putative sporulation protein YtxC n=1 Tax=Alteribacter aurantiacus TaxID=254410 RepID=UPI0003FFBF3D|nr:putative sporulation protein YtxC [Alteribacter aurantiacus]